MRAVFAAVTVIALPLTLAAAGGQAPLSAPALAARVQAHYATVKDFTAGFTLSQTSALMPRAVVERGTVKIKKPSRMRWTYESGDKQEFVADGTRLYAYFPKDKYVTNDPLPTGDDVSTALLFLAGRGDLTRDFVPSLPDEQPAGEWRVILKPTSKKADFKTLTLDVDRATLALRGFTVIDQDGGTSRFRFVDLHENRGLSDREFEFTMPKGVELR